MNSSTKAPSVMVSLLSDERIEELARLTDEQVRRRPGLDGEWHFARNVEMEVRALYDDALASTEQASAAPLAPEGWWTDELQKILAATAGEPLTVTFDMKRAANIALKVARGERWSDEKDGWTHPLVHFDQIGAYRLLSDCLRHMGNSEYAGEKPLPAGRSALKSKLAAFLAEPEAAAVAGSAPPPAPVPTEEQIERHTLTAKECPPDSKVMLVSAIRRLRERAAIDKHGGALEQQQGHQSVPDSRHDELVGDLVALSLKFPSLSEERAICLRLRAALESLWVLSRELLAEGHQSERSETAAQRPAGKE